MLVQADEASASGAGSFEEMFARLADMPAQESEEEMKSMLETMMSSLMSKDVLYEPLKELHDKVRPPHAIILAACLWSMRASQFPGYLKEHNASLSAEDKTRYEAQFKIVGEIVTIFEGPGYSEDDPDSGLRVVELMQEVRSLAYAYHTRPLMAFLRT